ncbi:MAG: glycosyltransferase family 39 protein [Phycisphaerae bacterium]|nr:glycosyltransferase family 39 protein [Phycisphaerae bacterium]
MNKTMVSGSPSYRTLLAVFTVAVVVRIGFVLGRDAMAHRTGLDVGSDGYELIAENLLAGRGYRFQPDLGETVSRPPAYPLFLAGIFYVVGGVKLWPVQVSQALLSAVTACACYLLALPWGRRAALLAGMIFAFYPGDWVACSRYLAEPLSTMAIMITLLLTLGLLRRPGAWHVALALGACLTVAVMARDINVLLPVVLATGALCLPIARGHRIALARSFTLAIVPVLLAVGAWGWRNYRLTGLVVFPSSNSGSTAYDGYHIARKLGDGRGVAQLMRESRRIQGEIARSRGIEPRLRFAVFFDSPRQEALLSRYLTDDVREKALRDPWAFLGRTIRGLARFWYLGPTPEASIVAALLNAPLLLLAIIGVWRAGPRRDPFVVLPVAVVLYYNAVGGLVNPLVRYALPAIPMLASFAGLALGSLWPRRRSQASVFAPGSREAWLPRHG